MEREEILNKVKKEQKDFDEMELQVIETAMRISTIVVPILSIFFIIFRFFNPNISVLNISDLLTIIFTELFVSKIYEFKKLHKKSDLILSTISFIIALCLFIFYIFV